MQGRQVQIYLLLAHRLGLVEPRVLRKALQALAVAHRPFNRETLLEALKDLRVLGAAKQRLLLGLATAAREVFSGDVGAALAALGGTREVQAIIGVGLELSDDGIFIHERATEELEDDLAVTAEVEGRYGWLDRSGALTQDSAQAEIGRGGIGRVLRAFDHHLGREVAVKELMLDRLPEGDADGEDARETHLKASLIVRFLREARVTGQLEHPNIVPTYELGRREDGTLYYTMKVVRGRTLAMAIAGAKTLPERLKLLPRFVDLCQAIAFAHSRGVVHRDIKPQNVMVGQFGQTVVLDWGLAKVKGERPLGATRGEEEQAPGDPYATVVGVRLGTPAYMSPEQARGEASVDERSDIYSLGAVLRVLLLGRPKRKDVISEDNMPTVSAELGALPLVDSQTVAGAESDVTAPPTEPMRVRPRPSAMAVVSSDTRRDLISRGDLVALENEGGVPNELVSICEKAMRVDREGRYGDASELADDVEAFLTGARVSTYEYGTWELLRRFAWEHRRVLWVTGIALLLLVAFGIYDQLRIRTERNRAVRAEKVARHAEEVERSRRAEAQQEGARAALTAGRLLEARAKLRGALEIQDSLGARALWWRLARRPLRWTRILSTIAYSVEFSPDGRHLAVGSTDRAIYLIDRVSGRVLSVLRGSRDQVMCLVYSPDGATLASVSWAGELLLWNVATGELRRRIQVQRGGVAGLAFHPSGAYIATGGDDQQVRVWRVAGGDKPLVTVPQRPHTRRLLTLAFSPDGRSLASSGDDRQIVLWDTAHLGKGAMGKGAIRPRHVIKGLKASVKALRFSPDGRRMISAGASGVVRLWDTATWKAVRSLKGHSSTVHGVDMSRDGRLIVSAGLDNTVRLWDAATGTLKRTFHIPKGGFYSARFGPRGAVIATVGQDHAVRLWAVRGGVDAEPKPAGHRGAVSGVAFGSGLVATGGADGSVRLWDPLDGRELARLVGHEGLVFGLAFSPDGKLLASVGQDRVVRLWDVRTRRLKFRLFGHTSTVYAVGFSPDSTTLASGGTNNQLLLWDVRRGRRVGELRGHTSTIIGLDFDSSGQLLASASADRTLRVWRWRERKSLRVFRGHTGLVWSARFGATGELLYSSAEDRTIRRWQVKTGLGEVLLKTKSRVSWIDVNRVGTLLAAPYADGKLRLMDLRTRKVRTLEAHLGEVTTARFDPKGERIATTSDDGTMRVWQVAPFRVSWRVPLLAANPGRFYFNGRWRGFGPAASVLGARHKWERQVGTLGRFGALHPGSGTLCLLGSNDAVELWDTKGDRRLLARPLPEVREVVARPRACLLVAAGKLHRWEASGGRAVLGEQVSAVAATDHGVYFASGSRIVHHAAGRVQWRLPSGPSVSAIGVLSQSLAVGYREGNISLFDLHRRRRRDGVVFEGTPASPVLRLMCGPGKTLIGGFANGMVGIWNPRTGALLHRIKLHGPVRHLLLDRAQLLVATELGQARRLDLSSFSEGYCDLLRRIWRRVPVLWSHGLPRIQARPPDHRCAR